MFDASRWVRSGRHAVGPFFDHPFVLLLHAYGAVRARWAFRGTDADLGVIVLGPVKSACRGGELHVASRASFHRGPIPTRLTVGPGAHLSIGRESVFNYAVTIEACNSIEIGERCAFGSWVTVRDTAEGACAPVVIGNDVWIAHGATICPGVHVGDGATVSAGSVVNQDVPPGAVMIGDPARVVSARLTTT
jgi:acetyltransferase-like isoleucine patch superfamily enzyme